MCISLVHVWLKLAMLSLLLYFFPEANLVFHVIQIVTVFTTNYLHTLEMSAGGENMTVALVNLMSSV